MVKEDPSPSWWSKLFGTNNFFVVFSPRAAKKEHSRGWGRGEGVQKKKIKKKKSRSSEMTAGLFLRSELNEHRV